ncbi:MAG: AmmeMemoRadiSam system protein B [Chloroflexi bacterium]|nr:AmmeMemoRadiSam system protein B [Chloroflexota bacterium]
MRDLPKLRPVETRWVTHEGLPYLFLRDPAGLSEAQLLVPAPVAPLLALCDGTRDAGALQAGLELRTGLRLPLAQVEELLRQLSESLFLDDGRFRAAAQATMEAYRSAACRQPALAGKVYPEDPAELETVLASFGSFIVGDADPLVGVVSPHIDYERGGPVYASTWGKAAPALQEVELAVILGTDHAGGSTCMTLTKQHYATPFGVLPTNQGIVDELVRALGPERSLGEEIHHVREHSVELAAVWLHYALGGRLCQLVPVLCGSLDHSLQNSVRPEDADHGLSEALAILSEALAGRPALVIAAGDLAHVGPAFGDPAPLDLMGRARCTAADEALLGAMAAGDADGFLEAVRREGDARRICGLSPIYLALRLLAGATGEVTGYAHCPADAEGGSLVSIAGVLLRRPTALPTPRSPVPSPQC